MVWLNDQRLLMRKNKSAFIIGREGFEIEGRGEEMPRMVGQYERGNDLVRLF